MFERKYTYREPDITHEEWDMVALCPNHKIRTCWIYEFNRQFARQGGQLPSSAWAYVPNKLAKKSSDPKWLEEHSYIKAINLWPEFLKTNSIPKTVEEHFFGPYGRLNPVRIWDHREVEDESEIIAVDLTKSKDALLKSFGKLLDRISPIKPNQKGIGLPVKELYKADLKSLGALRISISGVSQTDAPDFTENVRRKAGLLEGPLYVDQPAFSKAISKAKSILSSWPEAIQGKYAN